MYRPLSNDTYRGMALHSKKSGNNATTIMNEDLIELIDRVERYRTALEWIGYARPGFRTYNPCTSRSEEMCVKVAREALEKNRE